MASRRFTTYAWATLWANIAVILWGAVVRATGSGAGCGSDWPDCRGEIIPRSPSTETLIEFSHRATSGVALLLVVGLLVWAWRAFPRKHPVRRAALASMVLMLMEAAIGAGLVLFELVAENESIARALFMGTHLGNTFLLLGALTLTAHWGSGGSPPRLRGRGRLVKLSLAAILGTILIGVSGAVAALGDTLYPPGSHSEVIERAFSPTATLLTQLRIYHPLIAILASLLVLYLVSEVRRGRDSEARRQANRLNLLVFTQIVVGGVNIYLRAPIWMQLLHLLLADLLWICLVLTAATALAETAGASGNASDKAADTS